MTDLAGDRTAAAPRGAAGFTLMELAVVVFVLSLAALLVFPHFSKGDGNVRSSARSLAALLRYLGDRGATTGGFYRLHFNLSDSTVTVRQRTTDGGETVSPDPFFQRRFISDGVTIADVELARFGKVREGEAMVEVGPGGLGEFLVIHLKGKGETYFTLFAYPNGGPVKLAQGYEEPEKS